MQIAPSGFRVSETHGILSRPGIEKWASSDEYGWSSLYASVQRETPYRGSYEPVEDHLLVLHLDGPVTIDREGDRSIARCVVPAGGAHFIPGGVGFGVRLCSTLSTLHVYIRREVVEEVIADLADSNLGKLDLVPCFIENDPVIRQLLLSVKDALNNPDAVSTLCVDYIARAIASRLVCRRTSDQSHSSTAQSFQAPMSPQIARAIEFMHANLEKSINLDELASIACQSPSHFARRFRSTMGIAPHQYLMQIRIEKAKYLLRSTSMPPAEIAFGCGFSHQEHMTRLFKRSCGTTPAAYRKQQLG